MLTQNISLRSLQGSFFYADLKYLAAYIVPVAVGASIFFGGIMSLFAVVLIFGVIPLFELIIPADKNNKYTQPEIERSFNPFFDLLLYLNVPIVYGMILYTLFYINPNDFSTIEWIGHITALGILFGSCGINVAHELGHRPEKHNRMMAKMLLLPSWYMHFIIEHNLGHHKNVSTPLDPATALRSENVYSFWFKSVWGSYKNAWRIEIKRLDQLGKKQFSLENRIIQYSIIQVGYAIVLFLVAGFPMMLLLGLSGIFGFLLLETINYIEHYGLVRKILPSGRYEPVQPHHSWNADYPIGRILLYELTRHSDHHFKSTRKYQVLRSMPEAPDLPTGYPGAMILALVPPIWFKIMHPLLDAQNESLDQNK